MAHGLGAIKDAGLHPYGEHFAAAGFSVLIFDYRTFGFRMGIDGFSVLILPYMHLSSGAVSRPRGSWARVFLAGRSWDRLLPCPHVCAHSGSGEVSWPRVSWARVFLIEEKWMMASRSSYVAFARLGPVEASWLRVSWAKVFWLEGGRIDGSSVLLFDFHAFGFS
eukprot:351786-Chlamydomonas_euryale.AAC.5